MINLSNVPLKRKLLLLFLAGGIIPMLSVGWLSYGSTDLASREVLRQSSEVIETDTFARLTAVRDARKRQLEDFFTNCRADLETLVADAGSRPYPPNFDDPSSEAVRTYLDEFSQVNGYYDLFVIRPDGTCQYAAAKEAEYRTNLLNGPYRDSGLGRLVRQVLDTSEFGFADFEPYAPSNDQPAAFIAQPVLDQQGRVERILALQLPVEPIEAVTGRRQGLGETGEVYLVGADNRMRSGSYLDPENRSVAASLSGSVEKNGVDTESVGEALAGNSDGRIVEDYRGSRVLSAYAPIDVYGTTWAVLAEIDADEAFAPIVEMATQSEMARMQQRSSLVVLVGLAAMMVTMMAMMIAMMISRPITAMIDALQAAAEGDFTKKVDLQSRDELGRLAAATNRVIDRLAETAARFDDTQADEPWHVEEPVEA